jgi:molecular chaperone DnaJ
VRYDLNLTFEEAALGCHKTIEFFRSENCATCHGTGAKPGTQPVTCPTCKGAGQIRQSGGWISTVTTCPACGGRGKVIKDKCPGCGSSGRTRARRTFEFNVPAGVDNNNVFYRRGEGEPGVNGGPNGDLAICIHVKPHKVFRRDGLNLRLDVNVPFTRAALGAEITIPTLEGDVKYALPEGTQPGAEFRIRGKGIAQVQGSGKGDLIFRVKVEIPRKLTDRQRELLREFDEGTAGRDTDKQKSIFDKLRGL